MKRHAWKSTGVTPAPSEQPCGVDLWRSIDRCDHCGTERAGDSAYKTLFLYRGGNARAGSRPIPGDRWCGYTVIPKCVERF